MRRPVALLRALIADARADRARDRTRRVYARAVRFACLAIALLAACGARTGLDRPPARDGGMPDSRAPDAAVPVDVGVDSGLDAGPPECTTSSDCDDRTPCTDERCVDQHCVRTPHDERCDDGLFCTGVEVCTAFGGCSASPPICADTISCTFDHCDEDANACAFDPDVSLCPISHRCDVTRGCVARLLAHDPTFLMEIDVPEGTVHTLGPLPAALTDIALAPDGTLYGAIPGELDRVDYVGGTSTLVVEVPGRFVALDVSPDGRFYGASGNDVFLIDVVSGTRTRVARLPFMYEASGDVAFVDGELLATANRDPRDTSMVDLLIHVPLDGSPSEIIGSIGHRCVWGLAPFGSLLYGLTCEGDLLSIDPTTGASTVLAHPGSEFYGAAAR
jgi:hypothetical protein